MKEYFFISDSDGHLYDTRNANWSAQKPLRPNYRQSHSLIKTVADFKATLRNGGFTFPGCYPLYFICNDGDSLSFEAAKANARSIMDSIATDCRDGWRVVACDVNYEDDEMVCAHTGKRIPSAYGNDE